MSGNQRQLMPLIIQFHVAVPDEATAWCHQRRFSHYHVRLVGNRLEVVKDASVVESLFMKKFQYFVFCHGIKCVESAFCGKNAFSIGMIG
jgi:hypothetical protein